MIGTGTSSPHQRVRDRAGHARSRTLTIRLSGGVGRGRTPLSAFDSALLAAGVANFNLVRLSSVIPPESDVIRVGAGDQLLGAWGDRLYCVYASQCATLPGEEAWAGIGWVLRQDGSGAGLFVEHEGPSRAFVEDSISASLGDLVSGRGGDFCAPQVEMASVTCHDAPACALVVAAYETAGWGARG